MKRIIVNSDTAGDDTIALLIALHHFKVEGVTITGGNVDFNQQVENALYTIQVFNPNEYVPVLRGYESPIITTGGERSEKSPNVRGL